MKASTIGENLRSLRVAKGLTQEAIARSAGISLPGYRNFEGGKNSPKISVLQALSEALGATIQNLLQDQRIFENVRFRAHKKLKVREQILFAFSKKLEGYNFVEELLKEKSKPYIPKAKAPLALAKELRKKLKLRDSEPVPNICQTLENLGIKVIGLECLSEDFFGLAVNIKDGGPAIGVNTWERIPVERWIFSAAHEAGHLFLHPKSFDASQEDEVEAEEKQANEFASFFLMPEEAFDEGWETASGLPFIDRVFKLKRHFRVSYATVLYRIKDWYEGNVWQIFRGQFKQRFDRSLGGKEEPFENECVNKAGEEPKRLDDVDFFSDRISNLVRKALEEKLIDLARGEDLLGISPKQMKDLAKEWASEKKCSPRRR